MKRKIGAPQGRLLYGAPKGARILPYSVAVNLQSKQLSWWTPAGITSTTAWTQSNLADIKRNNVICKLKSISEHFIERLLKACSLELLSVPSDAVFYIYPSRPLKCCSQNKCTWGEMLCSIHPELFSSCFVVIVYLTFCFATLFVSSFAKLLNQLHSDSPNSSCSSARLFGFAWDIIFSPLKVNSPSHPTALIVVLLS